MKRKFVKGLLAIALGVVSMATFTACKEDEVGSNSGNENGLYALQLETVYAMAQEAGFEGTLDDLIEMFKGEKGSDGVSVQSASVEDGKLYLTLSNGNSVDCGELGIENGKDGVNGVDGKDGKTPTIGENGNWFIDGEDTGTPAYVKGDKGDKGEQGQEGDDGVGIEKITLVGSVGLVDTYEIEYTDGNKTTFTVTNAKSVVKTEIVNGDLIIHYNNDTQENVGKVVGENGAQGAQGVGVENVEINDKGELIVTLTDGTPINCGVIKEQTHVHTFGEWLSDTDGENVDCTKRLFYHVCSSCKTIEWKKGEYADHDWKVVVTAPTCQEIGYTTSTCERCDKTTVGSYTDKSDHIWADEYGFDNAYHWLDCTTCDEIKDKEYHTYNDEGVCSICEYPEDETAGILYEVVDGKAKVVGYEGVASKVLIANEYEGVPVTEIGEKAFYNQKSLKSVEIPNTVTTIGNEAFSHCAELLYALIPEGVLEIGDYAFYRCPKLTQVVIPEGVTTIGNYAFGYCIVLTDALIPEGVLEIGDYAFYHCDSLEKVIIPDSVTRMGSSAFSECSGLKSVVIGDGITVISGYTFFACRVLTDLTIGKNVTTIEWWAFGYCASLTNVEIPDGVTTIEAYVFFDCTNLTSVEIPDSVMMVSAQVFRNCDNLQYNVYNNAKYLGNAENGYVVCVEMIEDNTDCLLHKDVKTIATDAFLGLDNLINIVADKESTVFQSIDGDLYSKDGKTLVICATGKTTMEIPEGVEAIEAGAFKHCKNLTGVKIPASMLTIQNSAFYGCTNLITVEISSGVTTIGDSAFEGCSSLTSVEIPNSVTTIGDYAFEGCSSLTSVEIPNSVTIIGEGAFESALLTSIQVDENNTAYKDIDGVLYSKDGKTLIQYPLGRKDGSFTVPDGVEIIANGAFYGSEYLTSIALPEGLITISDWAFGNCWRLFAITIPKSVTSIGDYALEGVYFEELDRMVLRVYYGGTLEEWNQLIEDVKFAWWMDDRCMIEVIEEDSYYN